MTCFEVSVDVKKYTYFGLRKRTTFPKHACVCLELHYLINLCFKVEYNLNRIDFEEECL
jgi:hypothetical protein